MCATCQLLRNVEFMLSTKTLDDWAVINLRTSGGYCFFRTAKNLIENIKFM